MRGRWFWAALALAGLTAAGCTASDDAGADGDPVTVRNDARVIASYLGPTNGPSAGAVPPCTKE
jgi:hypothetical protein